MLQAPQRLHVDVRAPGDTMTVFHPPRDITPVEIIIRWFFSVPQWVQLTGAALAVLVVLIAVVLLWRNAHAFREWLHTRHVTTPMIWKAVFGLVGIAMLLAVSGSSTAFFFYSQNDNQFCLSCHTLHDEVFERFQESKHHKIANLRCHDCHDEPLAAEMAQVGKWMLLRPERVGPHAPVPRAVCASCHVRRNADTTWQRIIATAGHSVHLTTDTAKRRGIDCLTCHGVTAHRFVPVAQTCAQSGCHQQQAQIRLGKMAGQTSLHCVTCHQFTAPIPVAQQAATARAELVPSAHNCLGCHAMQQVLARFVPANDPHKGRCGDCHNPHTQKTPRAAFESCSKSGCHVRPDTLTPFHRGLHAAALSNCGSCHEAHTWTVRGTACLDCHKNIFNEPPRRAFPPTVEQRSASAPSGSPQPVARLAAAGAATALVRVVLAMDSVPRQPAAGADTTRFSHATHRGVQCSACHSTTGPTHGAVRLQSARDCERCHHESTVRSLGGGRDACLHCHRAGALPAGPLAVTVRTSTAAAPIARTLPFAHATHSSLACASCHTTPVTLAAAVSCSQCHADHHAAARDCRTCHDALAAHRGTQVHLGCTGGGCHTDRAVSALASTRNVCLSCHVAQADHKPGRDCGACHQVHWAPGAQPAVRSGASAAEPRL
jgi:nitrate/TMAO reductase-like tetraheme cytochrome c subunit